MEDTATIADLCHAVQSATGSRQAVSLLGGFPPKPLAGDSVVKSVLKKGEVVIAKIQGATDHVAHAKPGEVPPGAEGGNGKILHVNSMQQLQAILQRYPKVVLDCFADWCGPCKALAPHFEEMARRAPQLAFVKVDVDEAQDIAQSLRVTAMPTIIFFRTGREVDRIVGADVDQIRKKAASL